jgi:hypothetical protein
LQIQNCWLSKLRNSLCLPNFHAIYADLLAMHSECGSPGGRHHELMTLAEEREFLSPWAKSASGGGGGWLPPWCIGCWHDTAGARSHPIHGLRKAIRRCRKTEKKRPENLATLAKPEDVKGRRMRLMFQDEARFGRRVRIRKCWACAPDRPVVSNGYEREFVYVYGAVSPLEGGWTG